MRRHLVRLAATLAVAGLASAGIATSSSAEDGVPTDAVVTDTTADSESGTEEPTEILVDLGDPSAPDETTPPAPADTTSVTSDPTAPDAAAVGGETTPPADQGTDGDAATPDTSDPATDETTPDAAPATDGSDDTAGTEGLDAGDVGDLAADAASNDVPPVPSVDEVTEAIDALPDHVEGEPLTATEVQKVADIVCADGEICVGDFPGAYHSIQRAIRKAQHLGLENPVIRVYGGTYDPFTVTMAVQIIAAEGADVNIRPQGPRVANGQGPKALVTVKADGVTIEGLSLQCTPDYGPEVAIKSRGTSGLNVEGIDASGCRIGVELKDTAGTTITDSIFSDANIGVVLDGAEGTTVSDSTFSDMGAGVVLDGAEGTTVSDSTFSDMEVGVYGQDVTDTKVIGNEFDDMWAGVDLSDFDGVTVQDNLFAHGAAGAMFDNGSDAVFSGNSVAIMDEFGVGIRGVNGFEATGNTFYDTGFAGIALDGWMPNDVNGPGDYTNSGVVLKDNTFYGPGDYGIYFGAGSLSDAAVVSGNVFTGDFLLGPLQNALYVDENVGGFVDATQGNEFGGCGPNAETQGVDLGGLRAIGSAAVLGLDLSGCPVPPAPPVNPVTPAAQAVPVIAAATHTGPVLAETGAEGTNTVLLLAGMLGLLGAGVVVASRRKMAHTD